MTQHDIILDTLRNYPFGLTTKEVSEHSGILLGNASSALSKLCAYGFIRSEVIGANRKRRWRSKVVEAADSGNP